MTKKPVYAEGWKAFSLRIRRDRAEWRCECIGQCGTHEGRCTRREGDPTTNPDYGVMLTVAHLDAEGDICKCKDETGIKCANDDHVMAACNRCHLVYDQPHHKENARRTRMEKKDAARALLV